MERPPTAPPSSSYTCIFYPTVVCHYLHMNIGENKFRQIPALWVGLYSPDRAGGECVRNSREGRGVFSAVASVSMLQGNISMMQVMHGVREWHFLWQTKPCLTAASCYNINLAQWFANYCPQIQRGPRNYFCLSFTWGIQVLRYPNFFLGNGSRQKRESCWRTRGCSLGWARPSGSTVLPVECL